MKKIIFLYLIIFCIFLNAKAQNSLGSITGKIVESSKPVEFINVFITNNIDTAKIISGTSTDSLGYFVINNLNYGIYFLKIQSIGYISQKIEIKLLSENGELNLGNIEILPDNLQLQSVDVVAFRKSIVRTENGFVVNADENLTQTSGNAADLLKNMPTILFDGDGNVSIRGKTPLILINGKNSNLAGTNISTQLEQIPASNIEKIEINYNPSAKYDANSDGGIINIVLKTNQEKGTNISFSLSAGYGAKERLNGSVLLNHKTEKWNFGLFYTNWYTTRTRAVNGNRTNFTIPEEYNLIQNRNDSRLVLNQELKFNTDYYINTKNTISFNAGWAYNEQDNNEILTSTVENINNQFNSKNTRHSLEIRKFKALEMELNYEKKFSNDQQYLTMSIINGFDDEKENTDIDVKYLTQENTQIGELGLEKTNSYLFGNITTSTIDYAQPVSKIGLFEIGYKNTYRYLNADYQTSDFISGIYLVNPLQTNIFKFTEQINAAYLQYSGKITKNEQTKLKLDCGIRTEFTKNIGKTESQINDFSNQYYNFFPSANISFLPTSNNFFKLSYSRKINRPDLGDLNPFIDITDSLNQHSGNSDLKPELINSYELAFNQDWKKSSLSVALFYRQIENSILTYFTVIDTNVFLYKPVNLGNAINYGIEGVYIISGNKFWSANLSYSLYKTELKGIVYQQEIATDVLCWYSKMTNNFTLWKGAKLQLSANYTSPVAIPQGKRLEVYYLDIGFQQKIKNDRGRIGIVVTDVFKTQKTGSIISDETFYFKRISKIDSRAILFTFAYTFGTSVKEKLMENNFKNE